MEIQNCQSHIPGIWVSKALQTKCLKFSVPRVYRPSNFFTIAFRQSKMKILIFVSKYAHKWTCFFYSEIFHQNFECPLLFLIEIFLEIFPFFLKKKLKKIVKKVSAKLSFLFLFYIVSLCLAPSPHMALYSSSHHMISIDTG